MLIFQFHHDLKPEFVDAYRAAILENAGQGSGDEFALLFPEQPA